MEVDLPASTEATRTEAEETATAAVGETDPQPEVRDRTPAPAATDLTLQQRAAVEAEEARRRVEEETAAAALRLLQEAEHAAAAAAEPSDYGSKKERRPNLLRLLSLSCAALDLLKPRRRLLLPPRTRIANGISLNLRQPKRLAESQVQPTWRLWHRNP